MSNTGHFMYFAFGSNLLKERLQLANPSAIFQCTGRLKDYVLNFGLWGEHVDNRWHGGVATIEPSPGLEVWGVVWKMDNKHLSSLDKQEGVDMGMYNPLQVTVETDGGPVFCRTYQMNHFHACPPSPQYKKVTTLLSYGRSQAPKCGVFRSPAEPSSFRVSEASAGCSDQQLQWALHPGPDSYSHEVVDTQKQHECMISKAGQTGSVDCLS